MKKKKKKKELIFFFFWYSIAGVDHQRERQPARVPDPGQDDLGHQRKLGAQGSHHNDPRPRSRLRSHRHDAAGEDQVLHQHRTLFRRFYHQSEGSQSYSMLSLLFHIFLIIYFFLKFDLI